MSIGLYDIGIVALGATLSGSCIFMYSRFKIKKEKEKALQWMYDTLSESSSESSATIEDKDICPDDYNYETYSRSGLSLEQFNQRYNPMDSNSSTKDLIEVSSVGESAEYSQGDKVGAK